jgi:hypothetical protein
MRADPTHPVPGRLDWLIASITDELAVIDRRYCVGLPVDDQLLLSASQPIATIRVTISCA